MGTEQETTQPAEAPVYIVTLVGNRPVSVSKPIKPGRADDVLGKQFVKLRAEKRLGGPGAPVGVGFEEEGDSTTLSITRADGTKERRCIVPREGEEEAKPATASKPASTTSTGKKRGRPSRAELEARAAAAAAAEQPILNANGNGTHDDDLTDPEADEVEAEEVALVAPKPAPKPTAPAAPAVKRKPVSAPA